MHSGWPQTAGFNADPRSAAVFAAVSQARNIRATYGIPGIFYEADGGGVHGLNERIRTKSVYDGRDYLHRLVKLYAEK
jgi:hypothetical protein